MSDDRVLRLARGYRAMDAAQTRTEWVAALAEAALARRLPRRSHLGGPPGA